MVLLVPFDGSELSMAALRRAIEVGELRDEEVLALTVVPDDAAYAEERGWLRADEPFESDTIRRRLAERIAELAPEASYRVERVDTDDPVATATLDVIRTIREVAAEVGATILFLGSENAGRVSTPLASVGNPLSEDPRYDIHIVRHADRSAGG